MEVGRRGWKREGEERGGGAAVSAVWTQRDIQQAHGIYIGDIGCLCMAAFQLRCS